MKIGILGTGMVAEALGGKIASRGHSVMLGSRSHEKAAASAAKAGAGILAGSFADAAAHGELLINCTSGAGSLDALHAAGEKNLAGKVLIDISNPLDFSKGMPPTLFVSNDDSLGERIQRAFPAVHVVKTLNTLSAPVMIDPARVSGGDHDIFLSGNDAGAKETTRRLLGEWFGWRSEHVIDLGDITTARGTESILPLWLRLWGKLQTPFFNFKITR